MYALNFYNFRVDRWIGSPNPMVTALTDTSMLGLVVVRAKRIVGDPRLYPDSCDQCKTQERDVKEALKPCKICRRAWYCSPLCRTLDGIGIHGAICQPYPHYVQGALTGPLH